MIDDLEDAINHANLVAKDMRALAAIGLDSVEDTIRVEKCKECAAEHEQLVSWLEELKSRQEADRWIPVSEGLPKDRKKVRVTAYWHERFQTMDASYYGNGVWWCVPFNNCGKHMRNDLRVIAWKSDDEPYKESEDK